MFHVDNSINSATLDINTDRKGHKNSAVALYGVCCAAMFIQHIYFTDNPERSHGRYKTTCVYFPVFSNPTFVLS